MKKYLVVRQNKVLGLTKIVAQFDDKTKACTFAALYNEQSENYDYWVYELSK